VWPNRPFEVPGTRSKVDEEQKENTPLIDPSMSEIIITKNPSLYNVHYLKQFKSFRYWVPVAWLALQNLNISAYIGTISSRFPGTSLPSNFNIIWAAGCVAIPFYGLMMDRRGLTFSILFTTIGLTTFSFMKLIPIVDLQYLTFVVVSTINVGMWGLIYSYLSQKFGFDNYGKLLGVMSVTVAVVGLLQYPLTTLTLDYLDSNYAFMDILFSVTSLLTFMCPIYLYRLDKVGEYKPSDGIN